VRRVALNTIYNQTKTEAEQKRNPHTKIQIGEISHEKRKQNKKAYYTIRHYTLPRDMEGIEGE
jgi:hypothetical protein